MSTKGIYLFLSLVSVPTKWIFFSTVLIYILAQNLFFYFESSSSYKVEGYFFSLLFLINSLLNLTLV